MINTKVIKSQYTRELCYLIIILVLLTGDIKVDDDRYLADIRNKYRFDNIRNQLWCERNKYTANRIPDKNLVIKLCLRNNGWMKDDYFYLHGICFLFRMLMTPPQSGISRRHLMRVNLSHIAFNTISVWHLHSLTAITALWGNMNRRWRSYRSIMYSSSHSIKRCIDYSEEIIQQEMPAGATTFFYCRK